MAELSRNFHNNLQSKDLAHFRDQEDHDLKLHDVLDAVPASQQLSEPHLTEMNWSATEAQIAKAIELGKNKTATGLDGCPYELWKALKSRHESLSTQPDARSFDIVKALTTITNDIQSHGLDPNADFAVAWMCPVFKKKDPTEIGNYRPISIMNTDYKLLTKVMAIQLNDCAHDLIHNNQAGFVPRRSIFNHIRLAKAIIDFAEITKEDGAIILLDQEKAYNKIRHDYLWHVLEAFHLPPPFIKTMKALYEHAHTRVMINGVLSTPFQISRGVRQGDPLSCPIFNLAIEPLACLLRNDPDLRGLRVPGLAEKLIAKLLADDTALYLSLTDRFDCVLLILRAWCDVSGAKFNIEKMEIIPIGSPEHRAHVQLTHKINTLDQSEFEPRIRIAPDGTAVRYLGAWIGNDVDEATPWEPIIDKIMKVLTLWRKAYPSMVGRKLIVQAVIGGYTQFLTKVQGMPDDIENALTKIIRDFMWEEDSSPRISLDFLHCSRDQGGLDLLDLKSRNEAIKLIWLKSYLNFSPSRPEWAIVMDLIIAAKSAPGTVAHARLNPFIQAWEAPTRGSRFKELGSDSIRMLKAARKHNTNLAAIRVSVNLQSQLPAWYHVSSDKSCMDTAPSRCLLANHLVSTVRDMLRMSARLRNQSQTPQHFALPNCPCTDCTYDRSLQCSSLHHCASEALMRIHKIYPKLNPLCLGDPHDNLSLTGHCKAQNQLAQAARGEILFDPSITCKETLAECFRIFTNLSHLTTIPAQRYYTQGISLCARTITVYTDSACFNNGKYNARCGSGVYFGPNDDRNIAFRPPGDLQSNQAAEIIAIYKAASAVQKWFPLKIVSDSLYAINGLMKHLRTWEDDGWIGIDNAPLFKLTAATLKQRIATTTFQWTRGHAGNHGNKAADRLAKEGANKLLPNNMSLDIPKEFDLQGAKLATLTQAVAYRGILERKPPCTCDTTSRNLSLARESLASYHNELKTDRTLWKGLRNCSIRLRVRQFLFKAMHGTQKIGPFWSHVRNFEDRGQCFHCVTILGLVGPLLFISLVPSFLINPSRSPSFKFPPTFTYL